LDQTGCKPFRDQNALFTDLYKELDKYGSGSISDLGFGKTDPAAVDPVMAVELP